MRASWIFAIALPCLAQEAPHVTYDENVRPVFAKYCFGCHNANEMTAGLNLETYQGVIRGGSAGDIGKPGRAAGSPLYQALARDTDGVCPMPLGQAKLPDPVIATIRDWIQQGCLE